MLKRLVTTGVGPAPQLDAEFGERLTLITGDNGVGKSFLLDVAWWVLTDTWPAAVNPGLHGGMPAKPTQATDATVDAYLETAPAANAAGEPKLVHRELKFDLHGQHWNFHAAKKPWPHLTLYAMADGAFAVHDSYRNHQPLSLDRQPSSVPLAYVFTPRQAWDGLRGPRGEAWCNGLLIDWAAWHKGGTDEIRALTNALAALSPDHERPITPTGLTRVSLNDVRDMPTLRDGHGAEVAIAHASSAIRRVATLAYLVTWAWSEHLRAAATTGQPAAGDITLMIDEVETHLHPRWQRTIVSALLALLAPLAGQVRAQVILTTHSPLVMASAEPEFDPLQDAWLDFDVVLGQDADAVSLERRPLVRKGDADRWLRSDAFHLSDTGSRDAEAAKDAAAKLMDRDDVSTDEIAAVEAELRATLGDMDPFWIRWSWLAEQRGWRTPA